MNKNKEAYLFYKAKGICVTCRKERALNGQVLCPSCAERNQVNQYNRRRTEEDKTKAKLYARNRRTRLREMGLCSCGRTILEKSYKTCEHCRRIARAKYLPKIRSHEICSQCDKPTYDGTRLCKYHYELAKKNIEKQRESGNYRNFNEYY